MYRQFDFAGFNDMTETTPTIALAPYKETAIFNARGNSAYHRRLVERLGRGIDWEYRGECCELPRATGKCSCGQEGLRYLFTIHHTRTHETAILGSSCINSYPGISPEVLAGVERDLERLEAEAAAREKAAKELTQNAEIARLFAEYSDALYRLDEVLCSSGRRLHWNLWRSYASRDCCRQRLDERTPDKHHPRARMKQFKMKHAAIKWLKTQINETQGWIADPWEPTTTAY